MSASTEIIFTCLFRYCINAGVTQVASVCIVAVQSQYRVNMFEVPVNLDVAFKESSALFAYVQSAAFLSSWDT